MNDGIHKERTASEPEDRVTELAAQQAAISEVLRAIASSPHDMQPIFDAIIDSATRLCRADLSPKKAAFVAWQCEATPLSVSQASSVPVFVEKGKLSGSISHKQVTHPHPRLYST